MTTEVAPAVRSATLAARTVLVLQMVLVIGYFFGALLPLGIAVIDQGGLRFWPFADGYMADPKEVLFPFGLIVHFPGVIAAFLGPVAVVPLAAVGGFLMTSARQWKERRQLMSMLAWFTGLTVAFGLFSISTPGMLIRDWLLD